MSQQRNCVLGKKGQNKHGFVERFFRVTPTRNAAFISKLFTMVHDETTQDLITWTGSGDQFTVFNNTEFSRRVLPHYFKHCNWSSFVRQLNMYDFHKINDNNNDEELNPADGQQRWDFKHPWFNKFGFDCLHKIRRKPPRNRLIPQIRYSSAMEILPSTSPDYEVGETFPVGVGETASNRSSSSNSIPIDQPTHISPSSSSNQHVAPAINEALSQLQSTTVILESKLESTTTEVQYLRKVTENQREVLNDLLATVEYLKSKFNLSEWSIEAPTRKPKKIHELLGSDNDHQNVEYTQYYPMQQGSHSPPVNINEHPVINNNRHDVDMEEVVSRSRGSSSSGARSKRRFDK
ncbi:unnamed protein product [Mucor hiemalis]